MVYQTRTRKRVHAIPRALDGSAFQNCDKCGVSVAIALVDMHECEPKRSNKRFKAKCGTKVCKEQSFHDQPRSAFRFFMDMFVKTCKDENQIDIDGKGFAAWKNMSKKERQPFVDQAEKISSAYVKALLKEVNDLLSVEDEADSAEVGKYDENYIDYNNSDDYEYSDGSGSFWSGTSGSFFTYVWRTTDPWCFGINY